MLTTRIASFLRAGRTGRAARLAAADGRSDRAPHHGGEADGPLSVWRIDEAECRAWDDLALRHTQGTIFHSMAWRRALVEMRAGEPYYIAVMRGARFVGILPVFETRAPGAEPVFESLPAAPAAGLLLDETEPPRDADVRAALWDRLRTLAQRRGVREIHLSRYLPARLLTRPPGGPAWVRLPVGEAAALARGGGECGPAVRYAGAGSPIGAGSPMIEAWNLLSQAGLAAGLSRTPESWAVHQQQAYVLQPAAGRLHDVRALLRRVLAAPGSAALRYIHLQVPGAAWVLRPEMARSTDILVAVSHYCEL
ncbi:MAG: hypothetical protein LC135_10985 [Phycisphaerae bacterium]|nr:hypothetical protein [Phycisphaerae bacterium]MCZ2400374.1 hypothetical protein [Phycisphaerae bacterium]